MHITAKMLRRKLLVQTIQNKAKQRECTLLNGIEYSRRMAGDITVILWRKKAGQAIALLGKNPASSISYPQQTENICALYFVYFCIL